jgi:hypothetical protein
MSGVEKGKIECGMKIAESLVWDVDLIQGYRRRAIF